MDNKIINFKKTVVGWYNFNHGILTHNIDPITFRKITGVSERANSGTCVITLEELRALKSKAGYIAMADGWQIVPSPEHIEGMEVII